MTLFDMAGHLIRRLNQISTTTFHKRMREAGYNITPVQFAAMQALLSRPNIEQAQVATAIAYDRATIGGVLDRLELKGYISRKVSKRDKRVRECCLSNQGIEAIEKVSPIVESLQQEILCGLDVEEYQQFIALAQKVITHDS